MTSYRRSTSLPHLSCAGESRGAYDSNDPHDPDDHTPDDRTPDAASGPGSDPSRDPDDPGPAAGSPLGRLAERLDVLEQAKRDVLAAFRDVAAWGGTAQTTGYTQGEWLTLVGRVPGREQWKYQLLARRLPGLPVTAALFQSGELSFDQAVTIVAGTKRLSGDTLADVEATAADAAVARNRRGDDPDVDADVEQLVQQTRTAAEQDRRDRDRLDRNQVRIQPDLFGAGRITEDWVDPEGFQTRLVAIEHAAGQPSPDVPRGTQLAEGSLATARAWLAGRSKHPLLSGAAGAASSAGDGTVGMAAAAALADGRDPAAIRPRAADPDDVDPWLLDTLDRPALPGTPDRPASSDLPTSSAASGLPGSPGEVDLGPSSGRPTLLVRIDIRDLDGLDPSDPDTLRRLATGSDAAFGRLASAGRLSTAPWLGRQLVDTLACNADLLVAITDGERPLAEFRRPSRLPDRIRRQVLWRDLGCRWPACNAPVAHCDVHHLDEDPTNHEVDNLASLCRRHHRRLHSTYWHPRLDGRTGRFDLLRSATGEPVHTTYPNGTPPQALTAAVSGGDPPEVG